MADGNLLTMVDRIEALAKIVDNYVNQLSDCQEVGLGLRLCHGNEIAFERLTGSVKGNTLLPVASLSKQFIGAAIILNRALFDVEETLGAYLECPVAYSDISLLELLNHTSGIPEYLYLPTDEELDSWSLEDCVAFIFSQAPANKGKFLYSNSNYVLLSQIIRQRAGVTYSELVKESVFRPAGMDKSCSYDDLCRGLDESATPMYVFRDDGWWRTPVSRINMGWGDAGFLSTIDELEKWFTSDLFKNYIDEVLKIRPHASNYSVGLFVERINDDLLCFHTGSAPGAESLIVYSPRTTNSLIYMTNHTPKDELMLQILGWLGL